MNSTFEILTTAQVEELMQQQIDDVKAVVSVNFSFWFLKKKKL